MEMFLLIVILVMVLVTMICSIITTIIEVKDEHEQPLVKKALGITSIAIIVVLVIALAFGVSNIKKDDNSKTDSDTVTLQEAGFNEVTLDEYLDLVNGTEKSIVLVARPTCSYCEAFAPILKQAKDEMGLTINYIDTDKFSSDDYTKFNESLDYLSENEWGTPLTLIVQNGEAVDVNNGYVDLDTIKQFFSDNGFGE